MDEIGTYEIQEFPSFRNPTLDILEIGRKKHHIPVLLEVDVTEGRRLLRRIKAETGQAVSFTAWIITCLGQAVNEHKHVHALRKGRRKLIVFDDVDVSVVVERSVNSMNGCKQTLPMPCVIRKSNEKSVKEIHAEIRGAQKAYVAKDEVQINSRRQAFVTKLFAKLPKILRQLLFWIPLKKSPFLTKKNMGTVAMTSIGNIGQGNVGAWAVPKGIHPLIVAIGGIAKKPGVIGDAIEIREFLSITLLFDHDVTDGAPVARFIFRFKELLETCRGLDDINTSGTLSE